LTLPPDYQIIFFPITPTLKKALSSFLIVLSLWSRATLFFFILVHWSGGLMARNTLLYPLHTLLLRG